MNNITVSIIIPVGCEYGGFEDCLKSFVGRGDEGFEILVGLDGEDIMNFNIARIFSRELPLRIFCFDDFGGYYKMHLKTNALAKEAKGDYIWWLSDECRILTNNWVNKFKNIRIDPKEETILVQPRTKPVDGAKYPAISRAWYKKTKQFTGHPSLDSWLNTVREKADIGWTIIGVDIEEVERDKKETDRGKVMGTGDEWGTQKMEKRLNKEAKKLYEIYKN
jgi:hypothetical protein